jgi:hypothetical protein
MASKSGRGVYAITIEPLALKSLIGLLNALDKETANKVRDAAQPLSKRLAGQFYQFGVAISNATDKASHGIHFHAARSLGSG